MNTSSMDEIYYQFHHQLKSFIAKKVKDDVDVKDILQEVFIKIQVHLHTLKDHTKLNGWIYRLTMNTIHDYYRFRNTVEIAPAESHDPVESLSVNQQGLENCVLPFISKLPPKYQEALTLTEINGMSQAQLASELKISYSAAKSRVQRGRQKLKLLFTDCCQIHTDVYGNVLSFQQNNCNDHC